MVADNRSGVCKEQGQLSRMTTGEEKQEIERKLLHEKACPGANGKDRVNPESRERHGLPGFLKQTPPGGSDQGAALIL